jgi:cytidylate kinase
VSYRIVCISRVTAAGSEAVGQLVAARLGFRYVDDEIIALAARTAGVDPATLENVEHHQGFIERVMEALFKRAVESQSYFERGERGYYAGERKAAIAPPADELRRLIQEAIVAIAERGQAVIGAHAASFALRGRTDVLRVHVVASAATRIRRLWVGNKLISEEEYGKALAEEDRQREKYLAHFYEVRGESATDYDLVLNTDALDVEHAVAAVVAAATGARVP